MKKLVILLLSMGISASIFASKVGVVDAREVMSKYKNTAEVYKGLETMKKNMENELAKEEVAIQKEQVDYNASPTAAKKTALEDKIKKFQANVTKKQQELANKEAKDMQTIQKAISAAITKVAQAKKIRTSIRS